MAPVLVLIVSHVFSMLGFATWAALLPQMRNAWGLTNAQAGIVGGMFFGGYIASVSHWTAATDRRDGRGVYFVGALVAACGSVGFGALARGFFIAFYTSSFGIGTALSLALAGFVAARSGWRMAFIVAGAGPLIAGALVLGLLRPTERMAPAGLVARVPFAAWGRVLRHRDAAGYVLGYSAHCLELFGSRSWMVAFLSFVAGARADGLPWEPPAIAAVVNLLSVPSSIAGNEIALRVGRRRLILAAMAASGASGIALGFSAGSHWMVVLGLVLAYSLLVMADSATLTAGLIAVTPPELRGVAMGLYSLAGFGGGMLGPIVFGAALDAAGGGGRRQAWALGYAAIGAGCLAAPLVVAWFGRKRTD